MPLPVPPKPCLGVKFFALQADVLLYSVVCLPQRGSCKDSIVFTRTLSKPLQRGSAESY